MPGTWSVTGRMANAREFHTATLLPDGRVLVTGGDNASAFAIVGCETYDASAGAWSPAANLSTARSRHTATLLPDGRLLIAGGRSVDRKSLATAELFDPGAGLWSPTGSMAVPHDHHTATLLSDGRVLIVGGLGGGAGRGEIGVTEVYDPSTESWSRMHPTDPPRYLHRATLLADGSVLVTGGFHDNPEHTPMNNVEIFDARIDQWTHVKNLSTKRAQHLSFLLPDGRVLVAGGWTLPPGSIVSTAAVEIYDPGTDRWSAGSSLHAARASSPGAMFSDASILVVAGNDGGTRLATAERYDPITALWTLTGSLHEARSSCTATLLADGRVLVAGGGGPNRTPPLDSAEVYTR